MSLTDPPEIITQLSTQLAACASWTVGSAGNWYPEAPGSTATTHAVLVPAISDIDRYAEGANGLSSGTLWILVYVVGTAALGAAETLGKNLMKELMAQHAGISFRRMNCALAQDPGAAKTVGGSTIIPLLITIEYGLSA